MKQIRIILKSGKELEFAAEDEEIRKEIITATDGTQYVIGKGMVEAYIITPMVKCPKCGRWTVPTDKIIFDDGTIRRKALNVCRYCGQNLNNG